VVLSNAIDAINHLSRTFHGFQITGNPEVGDHMAITGQLTHSQHFVGKSAWFTRSVLANADGGADPQ
jgi:hypothetical protein